ncbi:MAG: hypothetical protein ACREQO_19400, partial [Candidatus Binatia bacterium]
GRLEARPDRWPDRQRLAKSLKATYLLTMGGSKEFNRLVELDLRRREFLLTLREPTLRPDRASEIKQELLGMNQDIDGVLGTVKGQVRQIEFRAQEKSQIIENIATIGLLQLALDSFSAKSSLRNAPFPSTKVGAYLVTDWGSMSSVETPEGQIFRCMTTLVQEEGAGIKCEPHTGK